MNTNILKALVDWWVRELKNELNIRNGYQKAYRAAHPERVRATQKKTRSRPGHAERQAEYFKSYYPANAEKIRKRANDFYWDNRERIVEETKARNKAHPEKVLARKRRYNARHKNDPDFKLLHCLRARVLGAMKYKNSKKVSKTVELLGCSIPEFKAHIEKQFAPWMTWENHGLYTWHLHHIRPVATFDLRQPEQQKECFHFLNWKPLSAGENLSLGAKWNP